MAKNQKKKKKKKKTPFRWIFPIFIPSQTKFPNTHGRFCPRNVFTKLRQWHSVFWITRLSQLSVHPNPTSTLDNREHTVALCVLEDIESYCQTKMTETQRDEPRELINDFRRNLVVVGLR